MSLYIEGRRGQIIEKIQQIFSLPTAITKTASGYFIFTCTIAAGQPDECSVGIVQLPKGFLVESYFANQKGTYDRVWMCDPFIGHVSYIETSNPDLVNLNMSKIDPALQHMELYAMPEDLDLIYNILSSAIDLARTRTASEPKLHLASGLHQTSKFL